MTRPRPERIRNRTGHADDCKRPMVRWVEALGHFIGVCDACGSIFTRRVDWSDTAGPSPATRPQLERRP